MEDCLVGYHPPLIRKPFAEGLILRLQSSFISGDFRNTLQGMQLPGYPVDTGVPQQDLRSGLISAPDWILSHVKTP